ncbi:unnamed protein product [Microthlaspi erraticum]|uniref:Uncharacterized protein n=1 Tax=Microthlaspi erraticum TaxID=1685480 RepID=A0A6D2IAT0_9BRAS|nr:unnamed protein product [Microthlaspi erraticum]
MPKLANSIYDAADEKKKKKDNADNEDIIAQGNSTFRLESERLIESDLGSNKFASLALPEEEADSSDSDKESDETDFMTPSGKRILRDRPVKPSTKAKEMNWQITARGRGNRGRGGCG